MDQESILRFWKHVTVESIDDCWLWIASKNSGGYGVFRTNKTNYLAHRFAWLITYGDIPVENSYHGTCVLHKCDSRACVNPKHLFLGTQNDNMKDMAEKKRGNANLQRKLSSDQAREIKLLLMAPKNKRKSLREIAKMFGVSHNTIWQISHQIAWKHD